MSAPAVSVILPTLNRAALLGRAMASVLNQSFRDLELIVVDDGSTDDTEAVIRSFADTRIVHVRHDRPTGDANARNAGLARARGAWVGFQDNDDEWIPHSLARRMELAARATAEHAAVASALLRVTPDTVELIDWPLTDAQAAEGDVDVPRFVAGWRAYLQSVLVRRSAFEKLGGFDAALKARSDLDFCLRLTGELRILSTHDVLAVSYESAGGLSTDVASRRADMLRMLETHRDLIVRDRSFHSRFQYDLAKAALACDRRIESLRAVVHSLWLDPLALRTWILLAATPFGPRILESIVRIRRHFRRP